MRPHAPFLLLLALVAPAMVHFAASDVIASLGDDSISYVMLARHILAPADVINRAWVGYQSHFPPLFPAVLAITGGASNLAIAHQAVAVAAILSIVLVYRYAALLLGGNDAGLLVALLFVLTPTAWISISGILSESLFLLMTLCALYYHEARLADSNAPGHRWLVFGILLGATVLTRTAGVALLLAYGLHVAIAATSRPRQAGIARRLTPFLPVALMVALWLVWRPQPEGFDYQGVTSNIFHDLLLADPIRYLRSCAQVMFGGWIRTFTADSDVHWLPKAVFALVGLLGIGGAILRARANRLDGWYVLILLAIVFTWLFSEDSNRRLLYGLVPVLLIHAGLFMRYVLRRVGSPQRRLLTGAIVALPTLLCFPAFMLVQERSWDREAIYPGLRYRFRDMADYYTTLDLRAARAVAAKHAAVLAGLESVRELTPPGARVMWLRPDYVAVLGHRDGVPLFKAAQRSEFLRKVRDSRTGYFVVSSLFKAGMDGDESSPQQRFNWLLQASRVVHSVRSRAGDDYEIAILEADRAAIDKMLAAGDT